MNRSLDTALIQQLEAAVGKEYLTTELGDCWAYGMDNSRRHSAPAAVLFATEHEQIAAAVRLCAQARVPVTARGRGTGTAGGAVPLKHGLVISTERMNKVLEFAPEDRLIVVQTGITNQAVQQAVRDAGFFWPPNPTSNAVCTVGGNLACNAAGPKAVKYGTTRDNVLGLKVVNGKGETLRTGTRTTKGVVGYDLTRLLIGSEGTLGIITEATLKLTPLPESKIMFRAFYRDMDSAAAAVSRLMAQPVTPSALEFIDQMALDLIRRYHNVDLPDAAKAMLMIEVDGPAACLKMASNAIKRAAEGKGCLELIQAENSEQAAELWAARKALSPTLRHIAPKKINEDVVVPVSKMPALTAALAEIAIREQITIASFGHAGNGNIHVNLLVDPDDPVQMTGADRALDAVFSQVLALGGTLSGEHGIGFVKRDYVGRELDEVSLTTMRDIQKVFDPHAILNPGKKLPAADD